MATEERDDPYKVPKSAAAAKPQKQHSPKRRHLLVVCLSAALAAALTVFSVGNRARGHHDGCNGWSYGAIDVISVADQLSSS